MLSVISCVFCYLSPRFFTGNIGSYTSFYFSPCLLLSLICQSLGLLTLIFCKSKFPETLGFTFKLLAISFQTFFGQSNFSSGTISTFYIGMLICLVLIPLLMFYFLPLTNPGLFLFITCIKVTLPHDMGKKLCSILSLIIDGIDTNI